MRWFTRTRVAKPGYRPFSEPRYKGSWPFPKPKGSAGSGGRTPAVYNNPGRARYYSSSFAALSGVKWPYGTAVRARTASGAVKGSTAWGTRPVVKYGQNIVSPDLDIQKRLREHIRRSRNKPNWNRQPKPQELGRFINTWGWDAFRAKVCQERKEKREVLHAKAIAGTRVARPTFDVRSLVRC